MDEALRQHLSLGRHREAFELVVVQLQEKVFRLAYSLLRDPTQAEDLCQDVFLRVWKALPGFKGGAAVSTWAYSITRNSCLTECRRRGTHPIDSISAPEIGTGLGDLPAMQTTDPIPRPEMDLAALLEAVPERYRQVLVLYYLEQKSFEEVATRLGLSLGTVKTFLYRAKRDLLKQRQRRDHVPVQIQSG